MDLSELDDEEGSSSGARETLEKEREKKRKMVLFTSYCLSSHTVRLWKVVLQNHRRKLQYMYVHFWPFIHFNRFSRRQKSLRREGR